LTYRPRVSSGRVVVLNGTSSAGKSTLAAGLQARLTDGGACWFVIGIDDMFAKLPAQWVTYGPHVGAHADEGIAFRFVDGVIERRIGPVGEQVMAGYRGWVASTARAGLSVIVDEVLLSEDDWHGWQEALAGLDVLWVQVACGLEAVEARERTRGDRPIGLARSQIDLVHRHPDYGVVVDTASFGPDDSVDLVLAALRV
jgi:chloramphenicol 3-O phosphotransferase